MKKITTFLIILLSFTTFANEKLTFNLKSDTGIVTEKSWQDDFLLIAVGYTSCPDICPTTMLEMKNALAYLDKTPKLASKITPLFITIDPISDSLEDITNYTDYFDKRIVGLRADDFKSLDDVVNQLRASYGYIKDGKPVSPPKLPDGYTVFHSTFIYLYSPERELIDVYPFNLGGDELGTKVAMELSK